MTKKEKLMQALYEIMVIGEDRELGNGSNTAPTSYLKRDNLERAAETLLGEEHYSLSAGVVLKTIRKENKYRLQFHRGVTSFPKFVEKAKEILRKHGFRKIIEV